MPDFSKEQSNKIQVWFKRGHNHNVKVQFIGDPLLRTQVDPILALSGSWQTGIKDVQTERGNNSTSKISIIFHILWALCVKYSIDGGSPIRIHFLIIACRILMLIRICSIAGIGEILIKPCCSVTGSRRGSMSRCRIRQQGKSPVNFRIFF
jgi:hypothetical protein